MINKEQILVVPVNYTSYIKNGFTGASSISTNTSYSLYDSTGTYEPRYKIDNNICFVKISIVLLFKHSDKFLVKELYDLNKRPCLELGINSYIEPTSGNYKALYNQITSVLADYEIDSKSVKINFIGYIRDFTNQSVKSTLGCIYYIDTTQIEKIQSNSNIYQYKWYTIHELIDKYTKGTSWSKKITDCLVNKTIII